VQFENGSYWFYFDGSYFMPICETLELIVPEITGKAFKMQGGKIPVQFVFFPISKKETEKYEFYIYRGIDFIELRHIDDPSDISWGGAEIYAAQGRSFNHALATEPPVLSHELFLYELMKQFPKHRYFGFHLYY
jgi:hypothetical protein